MPGAAMGMIAPVIYHDGVNRHGHPKQKGTCIPSDQRQTGPLHIAEENFHRFDSGKRLADGAAFEDAPEEILVLSLVLIPLSSC